MKLIYMGTPEFAVLPLEVLSNTDYSIPLVLSQEDSPKGRGKKVLPTPVKEKAIELGLEVFQPKNVSSKESINKLREINPDFIVVAAYGQILSKEVLSIPKYGCINIHASLLSKYRGAAPINWVIINGERETGVTTMKMDSGIDTGDILLQESIEIGTEDDSATIYEKLSNLGGELIVKTLDGIKNNTLIPKKQDQSKATYAPMINKSMGRIDWNKEGNQIVNLVRGLKPWPFAYTFYGKDNVKIHKAKAIDKIYDGINGEIVHVSDEGAFVIASDSCVIIEELQFPGKKRMPVREFIKGNPIEKGIILK